MFKRNDLKIYIKSVVDQNPQLSQILYFLTQNIKRALNVATAEFEKLYQNEAAKLEKAYATPDSGDWNWYWRDLTETEEIFKNIINQQAHKSGNATSINNKGPGNVAQSSNNSSSNNWILMIQLPADNLWT